VEDHLKKAEMMEDKDAQIEALLIALKKLEKALKTAEEDNERVEEDNKRAKEDNKRLRERNDETNVQLEQLKAENAALRDACRTDQDALQAHRDDPGRLTTRSQGVRIFPWVVSRYLPTRRPRKADKENREEEPDSGEEEANDCL